MNCGVCGADCQPNKRFCADCGAPLIARAHPPHEPAPPGPGRLARAEHRWLTVLFADLVGSTELSTRIHAEDFRDVIAASQTVVADAVARFGGFVARFVGDAALALFGYPEPHENDPERAVRAALAAQEAIGELRLLNGQFQPRLRIGIATGRSVVGDLLGSGTDVAGETPNLGARLHDLARPGEVIISEATRTQLGRIFDIRRRADARLKGFPDPVPIYRVLGLSRTEPRPWIGQPQPQAPLLGRETERARLHLLWDMARVGAGQAVLLTGEPGIGKSRLLSAFQDDLAETQHIRLRYFCSPYHTTSALQPVVAQIERAARFARGDSAEQRLGKLGDLLEAGSGEADATAAIADLLALRSAATGTPQERKERTLRALITQLQALSDRDPVLLVVEDTHWADPTSRELIDQVVATAPNHRLLAIFAARPEYRPHWTAAAHVTTLTLQRFEPDAAAALIRRLTRDKPLPGTVTEDIIRRSDGVPLFLEELTKAVLDSGQLVERETHYELVGDTAGTSIPQTLAASLLARLGPPSVMRELALIGATIGREFSHEILAAVSNHPEPVLREAMGQLIDTGLVFVRSRLPEPVYAFRHALLRDAAYGILLRDQLRGLHAAIAAAIRSRQPEIAARQPELIAQHYQAAGMAEQALAAWSEAARRAGERWAMGEAVRHLEMALEVLGQMPPSPNRDRQELAVVTALGNALIASRGYTAPRTGAVYERARVLCERLNDTANLIRAANGQWSFHLMRSEIAEATAVADDVYRRFVRQPLPELGIAAHRLLGISLIQVGRLEDARTHLEAAAAQLGNATADTPGARDAAVAIPAYLSVILAMQGRYAEAYAQRDLALRRARASANPHRLAFALGVATVWFNVVMDDGTADLDGYAALTQERDFPFWHGFALAHRGIALARSGDIASGLALVREGEAIHRAMGTWWGIPQSLGSFAGHLPPEEGLPMAAAALHELDVTGVRWFAPELRRIQGDLQRRAGRTAAAEASYRAALAEAEAQGSYHWAIRIALGLAALHPGDALPADINALLRRLVARLSGPRAPREVQRACDVLDSHAGHMRS